MLGTVRPMLSSSFVISPLRPSIRIQEYAPRNGGESMEMMTRMLMSRLPRILNVVVI